ncbi:MAG: type II secretion system ATPase GspE [Smithellaceae bacterium]|nr:type II secretion system ATPase GspE [Syntrophaceae bacterium]MDD4242099.1 type II secretion system ATPase GspE [Smithellaceae bacterium]NLX53359.1 type II secretion system ATPase GspE [Deltaproteobacteria bacterium]
MSTILSALNASADQSRSAAESKTASLADGLLAAGVAAETLAEARDAKNRNGAGLVGELLRRKAIDEVRLLRLLAEHFHLPFRRELPMESINIDFTQSVPIAYLKKHKIVPVITAETRAIAINDPANFQPADDLRVLLEMPDLSLVLAPQDAILAAINLAYDMSRASAKDYFDEISEESADDLISEISETADLLDETSDAPIIKLVNLLVSGAIKDRASDIHVEPYSANLKIRYRIDGILYDILSLPRRIQSPLVSRIKIMARLNIAEKRLPQDGRIELKIADRLVDVRVSVLPTAFGERVVLRLLDKTSSILRLRDLGMHDERIRLLEKLIKSPYGIILVTGPTGSGKTTTLYAALSTINRPEINIITIEDPIEYQIDGVGQIQVNPKIDLTFAAGLRSIVRQDPDVILVGEIRDRETAEIAIQSSLTGHLVFSTLHTNDAASAVTRLIDMGVEPFLVTSSVVAIIAQRLVRVLCPHCKEIYTPDEETLANLGLPGSALRDNTFYRKKGCNLCMQTGFRGRTAIFEILVVDDAVRKLVLKTSDANQINELAVERGLLTLQQDGIQKVLAGTTTTEEVLRVTRSLARKEDIVQET